MTFKGMGFIQMSLGYTNGGETKRIQGPVVLSSGDLYRCDHTLDA